MLDDAPEYKLKVKKLMVEFDNGNLPDTDFINSFMPRVADKVQKYPLSVREKEVVDDLFEKY